MANEKLTQEELEEIFKINLEIQKRCGDGTGINPISHSQFCKCKELNKRKKEILAE